MKFVIGALAIAPFLAVVVGALRGRVRVRSCCADARHDLRMREAFSTSPPAEAFAPGVEGAGRPTGHGSD